MTLPLRRTAAATAPAPLPLESTGFAETLINAMEAKNAFLRGHSHRVADLDLGPAQLAAHAGGGGEAAPADAAGRGAEGSDD